MNLTFKQIKCGEKLFQGRIVEKFDVEGKEGLKTSDASCFVRKGGSELPDVDRRPYVEIFKVEEETVLLYLANHTYSTISPIPTPQEKGGTAVSGG